MISRNKLPTLTWRKLTKRLRRHDSRFEFDSVRGKGGHRMIIHPDINGRRVQFPVPVHGEGVDISPYYVDEIIAQFNLDRSIFLGKH